LVSRGEKPFSHCIPILEELSSCIRFVGSWCRRESRLLETSVVSEKYVELIMDSDRLSDNVRTDVQDRTNTEMLPLHRAVNAGNFEMVKLLRGGEKINQLEAGVGGKTALQIAAKNGNVELLILLLDRGANVNQPAAEHLRAPALQFAAVGGHIEVACRLLNYGADVNAPRLQEFGRTEMEGMAAERGHIDRLQLMLSNGAQTDGPGWGQFIRSVKLAESNGHLATARFLKSSCGWTEEDETSYDCERFDEDEYLGLCLH
jgi:ankyrin repeat protein